MKETTTSTLSAEPSPFEILARLPARHRLMMLTMGRVVAPVIWGLTELRVADHLDAGPLPVAELAERTGTDPNALYRMLRCAAAFGVFTELPDGRYALTEMSVLLCSDAEQSVRDLVLMNGTELFWRPYEGILHSARTGRPAFEEVFGVSLFEYLEDHPEVAEIFHRAMTATNRRGAKPLAEALDLSPFQRVADIGGGQGYLLAELLARNPHCTGLLLDRPQAVAEAGPVLAERGLEGRAELVPGDFFAEVPAGCDAYLLKHVLHDWSDDDAVRILRSVRSAVGADSAARLFVIEHVVGRPNTLDVAAFLDMDMMVSAGGRERSAAEYRELAAAAGFAPVGDRPAAGLRVLEFRPSGEG